MTEILSESNSNHSALIVADGKRMAGALVVVRFLVDSHRARILPAHRHSTEQL